MNRVSLFSQFTRSGQFKANKSESSPTQMFGIWQSLKKESNSRKCNFGNGKSAQGQAVTNPYVGWNLMELGRNKIWWILLD
jgi:hypothetical protein